MLKYVVKFKDIYYDGCILLSDLDKSFTIDVNSNYKILYNQNRDILFKIEEDELKLYNTGRKSAVIASDWMFRRCAFPSDSAFRSFSRKYIDDLIKHKEFQDMNPVKETFNCKVVGNYTIYKYRKLDNQLLRVNNSTNFYDNRDDAYRAAQLLATNNPGETYVVLQVDNAVTATSVYWAR